MYLWRKNDKEFYAMIHGQKFVMSAANHTEALKICFEYVAMYRYRRTFHVMVPNILFK